MRTYHSCDVKSDFLDDNRTRLKNAQDELVTTSITSGLSCTSEISSSR
jgi:hypothetical protein